MKFSPRIAMMSFFIIFTTILTAQVGIGTITPDDGSALEIESTKGAFVPPRMTAAEMNLIPTPLNGAVVYNTTNNDLFIRKNGIWENLGNSSLVLNRNGGTLQTPDNTYVNFPLNTGHITSIDTSTFEVTGNGTITVKKAGVYMLSASFSTSNLPSGSHKYIIGAYRGGTLIGYLSRGYVSIPSGNDYFGSSGVLTYLFAANDSIEFRYVLNNGNNTISAAFFNIAINKMQ